MSTGLRLVISFILFVIYLYISRIMYWYGYTNAPEHSDKVMIGGVSAVFWPIMLAPFIGIYAVLEEYFGHK